MVKKKASRTSFLTALGRPAFSLLIVFVYLFGLLLLLLNKLSSFKVPKFQPLRLLGFPKIRTPHFSALKIRLQLPAFFPKIRSFRFLVFTISVFGLSVFVYMEFLYRLPDPKSLTNYPSKLTTQILDRNGVILYKIYKDENRTLISLGSLPTHVKNAFLAAEDKDFYSHNGFSLPGLLRAVQRNLLDNKQEGGSTITQQLMKNTILSSEKTLTRKIKEIILAIKTEHLFTKNEIFEMYLNQVGFGGPAYGIQEAARQYFDIDAVDLNLSQSAFLAGITRAPSKYSPYGDNPELALARQKWVLQQMFKDGMISEPQLAESLSEKLEFKSAKIEIKAPHFVMLVKSLLVDQLGENLVTQGGLKVYTTLDSGLQDRVQDIVTSEISRISSLNVSNGSALVTDPKTGEVLAMVGSTDYFDLNRNGQVNLTTALRQPGSSIKPLNYALYFENGHSPAATIDDKPITIRISGQEAWSPKNYDGQYHGTITLRQALASSYNIPSVLLLLQNGLSGFAEFAKKLGITSWDDTKRYGPSMALGSLEVSMVDLATAYSTFANEGITTPLHTISKIERPDGSRVLLSGCTVKSTIVSDDASVNAENVACHSKQTISPVTAYLIADILSDNLARSPAFGSNSVLNIKDIKVAVKTGTSNDLKDNWAIGFTPDFLVATWVGNNDNTPMSKIASGITGASPIWAKITHHLLDNSQGRTEIRQPENLVKVPICILTGTLTCNGCPTRTDYFIKGTEPRTACDPADIARRLQPTSSVISSTTQIL